MVDEISIIEFFIVAILVSLSAFFSSAETAFISVNRIKMLHLSEKGNKRAKIIHEELQHPDILQYKSILIDSYIFGKCFSKYRSGVSALIPHSLDKF